MFQWKSACLACLLGVAAGLPLHYGSLPVQAGTDVWPLPLLLGLGLLAAAVSVIVGCVCCHRFGKGPPAAIQGFNNATYDPTPAGELTLFPPVSVVSAAPTPGRPQFEPLPELTAAAAAAAAAAHPRPAIYNLSVSRGFSAKDWF
ncbi:uncharacterized protein LOC122369790, partial [Amphibalanus amphitrite]|uniref:uncharacterized protein LOC122369790 n=1 Tax=Amphibalanus amphitrite TaxID=1232801 RepID=UPI001C927708